MFGLSFLSLGKYVAIGAVIWWVYGWGSQIITNYSTMQATITTLERDNKLINSRVASYQTLLARRDAAIAASRCREQIKKWIKDPDTIPGTGNPFTPNSGG